MRYLTRNGQSGDVQVSTNILIWDILAHRWTTPTANYERKDRKIVGKSCVGLPWVSCHSVLARKHVGQDNFTGVFKKEVFYVNAAWLKSGKSPPRITPPASLHRRTTHKHLEAITLRFIRGQFPYYLRAKGRRVSCKIPKFSRSSGSDESGTSSNVRLSIAWKRGTQGHKD